MSRKADKKVEFTPFPGAPTYWAEIYADENCAYIFDPKNPSEPAFKLSPINDKNMIEIAVTMRKAVRFLNSIDKTAEKLRKEGFEFLDSTKPLINRNSGKTKKVSNGADKKDQKDAPPKPKWM